MESTLRVLTGQLYLDEADANGLRVKMRLAEDSLTLSNDDGALGAWTPLATEVEELGSERFRLMFGSEHVVFAPDDPVEFRYEIAPELGERETRKSKRASRKAKKKAQVAEPASESPEPKATPTPEKSMDEFLGLFKELAAVQAEPPEPEVRTPPRPDPPTRADKPDPYGPSEGEPAELIEPTVVEPTPHEPLVAPPQEPAKSRPAAKRKRVKTTPRHSAKSAKKEPTPVDGSIPPTPDSPDIDGSEPTPAIIANAAEKGLAGAQAAAASLEKAKAAPAAISSGVRRLFTKAKVEEHRHRFESNGIPGGLVRHICTDCGHVSVDIRDEAAEKALENSLFQRRIRM